MTFRKTLILCIVLGSIFSSLKADYYKPDFFPIGLTGINYTGDWNCPYDSKGDPTWEWTPQESDNNEQDLIKELGVNCIGCEDAWQNILIDFAEERTGNTYLEEVLTYLADERADTNCYDTVYLITATYGAAPKRFDKNIIFKYTEANL